MKKKCLIFTVLFGAVLLLNGCTKTIHVTDMRTDLNPNGSSYDWIELTNSPKEIHYSLFFGKNGNVFSTLIYPKGYINGDYTSNKKKDVSIKDETWENGELVSIVVDGVRYTTK